MGLLKEMNIFVRTHMSALEPDQVAAVRVRWEREKRKPAVEEAPKKGRRKVAKAAEPAPTPEAAKPVRRRRTAAEVAESEAHLEAVRLKEEVEKASFFEPIAVEKKDEEADKAASIQERAKALFKDLPPVVEDEADKADGADQPAEAAASDIPVIKPV